MTTDGPRPRSTTRIVVGAALVVTGIGWLLHASGVVDIPARVILPVVLIAIGVLLIANARHGANPALVTGGAVVAAALAIGSAVAPAGGSFAVFGDRREQPTAVDELSDYGAAFGRLTLDLTGLRFPAGTTRVKAGVAFGSLVVIVPSDVRVAGRVDVSFGEATVLGSRFRGADGSFADGISTRVVQLDLSVRFGDISVRRDPAAERSPPITRDEPFGRRR